jgi:tetratricopeptide (TPR) repeat protein
MESAEHSLVAAMAGKRPTPIIRDAHALMLRGIDALERNHVENAVGLLRQSVELDPDSFFGCLALGIALTKALEIPAAETALQHAIRLEPKNFWAHFRMAELYQRVGVPLKAKEEFQAALDLAETAEQRKAARDRIEAEQRREPRRAWRPDFSGLFTGKSRKK